MALTVTPRVQAKVRVLDFIERIHEEMKFDGLTVDRLAVRIPGVSLELVQEWLSCETQLTAADMYLLAHGVGCELEVNLMRGGLISKPQIA